MINIDWSFEPNDFERTLINIMEEKIRTKLASLNLENLKVQIRKDQPGSELSVDFGEALQELRQDYPRDRSVRAFAYFGDPWRG
jgi:hypothetical protein